MNRSTPPENSLNALRKVISLLSISLALITQLYGVAALSLPVSGLIPAITVLVGTIGAHVCLAANICAKAIRESGATEGRDKLSMSLTIHTGSFILLCFTQLMGTMDAKQAVYAISLLATITAIAITARGDSKLRYYLEVYSRDEKRNVRCAQCDLGEAA